MRLPGFATIKILVGLLGLLGLPASLSVAEAVGCLACLASQGCDRAYSPTIIYTGRIEVEHIHSVFILRSGFIPGRETWT